MRKILFLLYFLSFLFATQSQIKEQRLDLFKSIPVSSDDIVFVGNSITNGGQWADIFPDISVKNRGISGNTTRMVLDRLSMITERHPRKIFLLIGVNDLPSATESGPVLRNITAIIEQIKRESPTTSIFVQSIFPVNSSFSNFSHNQKGALILEVNEKLKSLCEQKNITYIDVHSRLRISDTNNNLNPAYTNDGLHLLGEGYALWASVIKPYTGSETSGIRSGVQYKNSNGISTYSQQLVSQYSALNTSTSDIIMYGDYTVNSADWSELFNDTRIKSRGINTTIDHLCTLLPNVIKGMPARIFIYAGAYDLFSNNATAEYIRDKIAEMTDTIINTSPDTEIYVQSILPRVSSVETDKAKQTNILLKELCESTNKLHYVDLFSKFKNIDNDNLNTYYTLSKSDINAKGYIAWANHIAPLIDKGIKPISPINTFPQAAFYDSSINSEISSPVWFFLLSATQKTILKSDNTGTGTTNIHTPLNENSDSQFWRFQQNGNLYTIVNKAFGKYLSSTGNLSEEPSYFRIIPATPPCFRIQGENGWLCYGDQGLSLSTDSSLSIPFVFVKAPVASDNQVKTWYQVKNERTTGSGGTLSLLDGNFLNVVTSTATPDFDDTRRFWSFNLSVEDNAYQMENKAIKSKYVPLVPYTAGSGSGGSSTVYSATYPVTTENPLLLVLSPLSSGKCLLYQKGTLGGDPLSYAVRFDFGSAGTGLYSRTLDIANGRYDFVEYDIKQELIQLVNKTQQNLDMAEEGVYFNQYPVGSGIIISNAISYARQILGQTIPDTSLIREAIDSIRNASLNFRLNGAYRFNKPGTYAIQYAGTVTNTRTNWYIGNTLIDNISDLGSYAQLFKSYQPRYCNWNIMEIEPGKFAFINNRTEKPGTNGDFINNLTQVTEQTAYDNTPSANKTFTIWMDEPEFQSGITRIAIETNAIANRFWSPFTGTGITAERVGYKSNSNYETNNFFRLYAIDVFSSVNTPENNVPSFRIVNKKIITDLPENSYDVFSITGQKMNKKSALTPGIYMIKTSEKSIKILVQ